jgi:hypothetical protein
MSQTPQPVVNATAVEFSRRSGGDLHHERGVFAAAGLNEHLLELGVRVKALRADPDCDSTVAEVDWGDLYPRIVLQDHPAPGVTIRPDAIPLDHMLVLAAERTPRPGSGRRSPYVRFL